MKCLIPGPRANSIPSRSRCDRKAIPRNLRARIVGVTSPIGIELGRSPHDATPSGRICYRCYADLSAESRPLIPKDTHLTFGNERGMGLFC